MRSMDQINQIRKLITTWIVEIKMSNAIYFYDINKISENLAQKVLNTIYNYNLENMNYKGSNYPGIDLGDEINKKVAFQITSREDPNKIKESLETFVKYGYQKTYTNGIRFLILSEASRTSTRIKYKDIYSKFDKEKHILTVKTLMQDIEKLYNSNYGKFKELLDILDEEFGSVNEINSQIAKADKYFDIEEYNKAIETYIDLEGKVKDIVKLLHIKLYQGLSHYQIAISGHDKKRNLLTSIKYYEDALSLSDDEFDEITYEILDSVGNSYIELALIESKKLNLERAKDYLAKALKKCNKDKYKDDYISIQNSLAITYENLAEITDMENNINYAILIYKDIMDNNIYVNERMAGMIFNNLGRIYEKMAKVSDEKNNLYESIKWYEKSLEIRDIERAPLDHAMTQNNLGNVYLQLSKFEEERSLYNLEKALTYYKDALEIREEDEDCSKKSKTMSNMGIVYSELFKKTNNKEYILKSIDILKEALSFRKIKDKPIEYAYTQHNLGLSYVALSSVENQLDNLDLAIESYKNSLKIFKEDKYENLFVEVNHNLCNAYIKKGITEKNTDHIKTAILTLKNILKTLNVNLNSYIHKAIFECLEESYIQLGELVKNPIECLKYYHEALDIFKSYGYDYGVAIIYNHAGNKYFEVFKKSCNKKTLDKAIVYLNLSLKSYEKLNDLDNISINYIGLGQAHIELYNITESKKDCEAATQYLMKALDYFNKDEHIEQHEYLLELIERVN